jgi:hypothetical protein
MKPVKIALSLLSAILLLNACSKEYSLEGGGLKVPSGAWQFKDSLKQFQGQMDTAYIESSPGISTRELHLIGTSSDGSQTFHMELFADNFTTGSYKASLFESSFEYSTPAKTIYQADQLTGEFIVDITTYEDNSISGTFSGFALDSANKIVNISQGKFNSTIGVSHLNVSSGVLTDSSGDCKPVTVAGVFSPGIALTFANTVQVQVTVATEGTYSISTNTVNGVTFSKSGVFNSTGVQTVLLNGSGVPANPGPQNFIISYGNSQCAFSVTF